jgi:hypothetical protein
MMQAPYAPEAQAFEEALMKTADQLSQKYQSNVVGRINLEVAIAANSATQAKQGKIQEPIRSNQCHQYGHLGQQLPLPSYQDVPHIYQHVPQINMQELNMHELSDSNTRSVEVERLINPLAVRFSIESICATFQDGSYLRDALSDIQTLRGDGDEYDLILNAPFPSIEIFRGSTLESVTGHWYTLDNHRLFCLQRAAAALWPARVAAYVTVPAGADTASWRKLCYTPSRGTSVSFQEAGMYQNHCLRHWDWQSEVKRISIHAAANASITTAHVLAALAVQKDCAKDSAGALQEDSMKTPRLTRTESFVNSDAGSDCGRAVTIATQSTTASELNDSEGSVPGSPKCSEGSKSKSPDFGPCSDPEVMQECQPIAISLAAAVGPMEPVKQIAPNNAKVLHEAGKQAKGAKKKDAKKQPKGTMVPAEQVTTLMIRGIPCSFTQEDLLEKLHDAGLKGKYDFFYLPRDDKKSSNLGYAFVNFVDVQSAEHCTAKLQGVQLDPFRSPKTCSISPGSIQGLPSLRNHFRNTAVNAGQHGPVFLAAKEKFRNQTNKSAKKRMQGHDRTESSISP